jgi:uncharacterized protein with FMN-binding domain
MTPQVEYHRERPDCQRDAHTLKRSCAAALHRFPAAYPDHFRLTREAVTVGSTTRGSSSRSNHKAWNGHETLRPRGHHHRHRNGRARDVPDVTRRTGQVAFDAPHQAGCGRRGPTPRQLDDYSTRNRSYATTHPGALRTIDGDPVDNPYGTVQVRVTLRGTDITDVTPLQMPVDRQYSAELSQQAAPLLLQEVLQAQSAQINLLTGASYTSQSYAQSLQSALDKAGH